MKQHTTASRLFILTVSGILGSLVGCSPEQTFSGPPQNNGQGGSSSEQSSDTTTTGGMGYPGTGGASAQDTSGQGGAATGGASSQQTGGAGNATGGAASDTGGKSSTGGTKTSTGGTGTKTSTGGTKASTGGSKATGGKSSTGGADSDPTGGKASTGGATAAGTTAPANTGTTVEFSASGKATGAMSGWGYVAMGATDTVTSPTCGSSQTEITATAPCTSTTNWEGTGLCVTGEVPIADTAYKSWGLAVGVGASVSKTEGLGQSFSSVTISVSGTPKTNLRAQVHLVGEPDGTTYCAMLTPGTAIPFTDFVTDCWETTPAGTAITAADVPNIDKIAVQVSANDTAAITVTNLCITGIEFAK